MRWIHRFSTVGVLATLAACASTEPSAGPGQDVTMDVATIATEMGAQDVEMMHGPGGGLGFGWNADFGRFNCESADLGVLTIVRTCTFTDADGLVQEGYDTNTTASVALHTELSGAIERDRWSATFQRTADLVVSGLAGANTTKIWNGSGAGTLTKVRTSDSAETRQYDMTSSGTITNVVIPVPRTATSWPLSGTIAREVTVTFIGGPRDGTTVTRSTTLEFNGTQFATLTVNGETFQVDLARRSCQRDGSRDGHRDGGGGDHDHDGR